MTTTNDVHPMVMKAARTLSDRSADECKLPREVQWAFAASRFIADAQAALTECGALECFDALEKLARLGNGEHYGNSDGNMIARDAIAKVCGSAPE